VTGDLLPFEGGAPELSSAESEALLSGEPLPADPSEGARAVSEVVAGLRAPASRQELVGAGAALTAFRASLDDGAELAPAPEAQPGRRVLATRAGVRVAVLAAVGSLTLGGVAAAATTGSLPAPLQRAAHALGAPGVDDDQGAKTSGGGQGGTGGASAATAGSTAAAASPEGSETASAEPSGSAGGKAAAVGPDATGTAAFGLCHAFGGGKQNGSVALRNLEQAAAAKGLSVQAYCAGILALGPGDHHAGSNGPPTDRSNGSSDKHGQHGKQGQHGPHGQQGSQHHQAQGTSHGHAGSPASATS
jgi:hypothetical protein